MTSRTPSSATSRRPRTTSRRLAAVALSVPMVAVASAPAAWAVGGEGYPVAPPVSGWEMLTHTLLIPAGLAVLITVVRWLPFWSRGRSESAALESTWLGGPTEGTEGLPPGADRTRAEDPAGPGTDAGGAGGRW